MLTFVQKFWQIFKQKEEDPLALLEDELRTSFQDEPLFTEHVLHELQEEAKMRGARDGARLYPQSDEEQCEFGQFLEEKYRLRKDTYISTSNSRIEKLRQKVAAVSIEGLERELENTYLNSGTNKLPTLYDNYEKKIISTFAQEEAASRDYSLFRTAHKRRLDPIEPHTTKALLIAGCLVCAEGMLNSGFFKDAAEGGLAQAFIIAVAIALFNVGASMGTGYISRCLNRVEVDDTGKEKFCWVKVPCFIWCTISIGLIVLLHHAYATVRTNFIGQGNGDLTAAWGLSLHDLNSVVWLSNPASLGMFIIGILTASFSFWEGRTWLSDPHPGYWESRKRVLEAQSQHNAAQEGLRTELLNLFSDTESQLREILRNAKRKIYEFQLFQTHYKAHISSQNEALLTAATQINNVFGRYVGKNIQHRGRAAPPLFFRLPLNLTGRINPQECESDLAYQDLMEAFNKAETRVENYISKLMERRDVEQQGLQNKLEEYHGKARTMLAEAAPKPTEEQMNNHDF